MARAHAPHPDGVQDDRTAAAGRSDGVGRYCRSSRRSAGRAAGAAARTAAPPPPPAEEQVEEEPAVVEAELPEEATTELLKEAENMTDEPKDNTLHSSNNGQQMGQPGKILLAVQPPKGGLSYKGRITVSAHVGKDGTVMSTKIKVSSGNDIYDNFARSLVQSKWKFQPATDTKGEPMESNIMCTLAFNVPVKRQMH